MEPDNTWQPILFTIFFVLILVSSKHWKLSKKGRMATRREDETI